MATAVDAVRPDWWTLFNDPMLNTLEVQPEVDYWAAQSEATAMFVRVVGIFVVFIFRSIRCFFIVLIFVFIIVLS